MERENGGEELSVLLVGAAGEGVQTIGNVLAQTAALSGCPVFTWQDFESRIRGGNSSYALRMSTEHPNAPDLEADLLLALNDGALAHYRHRLRAGGLLVRQGAGEPTLNELPVSFNRIAREEHGGELYANSVAAGYLCAFIGLPLENLQKTLRRNFERKGEGVTAVNVQAANGGYALAPKGLRPAPRALPESDRPRYLISGHEALANAASASGLRFIAAYPMSPSTSIISHLAQRQEELGVFLVQAEDEIAAINMVLGASYAGARAMTCTSGGGFALMVEAISLAGMTETPAVIVLAMRPGPATGLPTRTAQGDLLFAINAGHGEFPKAVLAPSDAADMFPTVQKAFHLADRYQIPVIILTDQHLADSKYLIHTPSLDPALQKTYLADPATISAPYLRYRLDAGDPVSPRLYPGQSSHLVCADSDEHDEAGHITEDLEKTVGKMVEKRRRKSELLQAALAQPRLAGDKNPDLTLISWGSTLHAVAEASARLSRKGIRTAHQHFTDLWPLPSLTPPKTGKVFSVEGNGTGQLQKLLRAEAGYLFHGHVGRTDGLPLDADHIMKVLGEIL